MNAIPMIDMAEVTRLTRAGRLAEATALLQAGLGILVEPPSQPAKPIIGGMRMAESASRAAPGVESQQGMPQFGTPRFEQADFTNVAGTRSYKLYVPGGYDGRRLPLIVMLHGCGQSPDDFAAGTRMNTIAEEQTFLVAYPAQSQAANQQRCWNWFNAAEQHRDQGEPSLIAGITREIMQDFAVDPGRVYIAGLSAGGAAAATMASVYPDLYAAACVHSGLACGSAKDAMSAFGAMQGGSASIPPRGRTSIPTIVFHGDRDATVHVVNGDQVIAQAKGAADLETVVTHGEGPHGSAFTRTVQSDWSGKPVLEQWVLHGARHAWSGGSSDGSFTDPRGVDASREMLRFFWAHARD